MNFLKNIFSNTIKKNNLFFKNILNTIFHSKRGITTTVFSWIFMSIIGGVILISVYSILSGYWAIEQENNNLEFAKALTNTLNVRGQSLSVSSGTIFNTIPLMGNKEARLECIAGEFTRLNIDGRQIIYEPLNEYLDNFAFVMPPIERELPQNIYLILENFNFPMPITPTVAIVPKSHIIIYNQTNSNTNQIFNRILNTRRSFEQLSIYTWNIEEVSTVNMNTFLNSLNPSSVIFVDFEPNFIHQYISQELSNRRTPVYHVQSSFLRSPSYIDLNNNRRIVVGNFRYTYSNQEDDFLITNQDNEQDPIMFNFYDMDDEVSIFLFGLFSTPKNFECAYNSLIQRSEFTYQLSKNKIDIILRDENTQESFCDTSEESNVNEYYMESLIYLDQLFENITHNLFTIQIPHAENLITQLQRVNSVELNSHRCELIY